MATTQPQQAMNTVDEQTTQWLLGWAVLIVLLVLLARTQTGKAIIYYSLALMVVFLFVTQYEWIGKVVGLVSINTPEQNAATQYGGLVQLSPNNPVTSLSYDFSSGGFTTPAAATM